MAKNFDELVKEITKYIEFVIVNFESGLYKMMSQNHLDRLKLLTTNKQPFITIFRDLHEEYYTRTHNAIINNDDEFVKTIFDKLHRLSNHSNKCILTILANLIVSIHFNLNRKILDHTSHDNYIKTLSKEIKTTIFVINFKKLFDHPCQPYHEMKLIPANEKFIKIKLSTKSNDVEKEIYSFTK